MSGPDASWPISRGRWPRPAGDRSRSGGTSQRRQRLAPRARLDRAPRPAARARPESTPVSQPRPPEPPETHLALLGRMERISFAVADVFVRRLGWWARLWNSTFMIFLTWAATSNRLRITGIEHVEALGPDTRALLAANHRSFFDFFQVMAVTFRHTRLPRRVLFPVRATFFYDHPLGPPVNFLMSGMAMFPPILRERRRLPFNEYALERIVGELALPGTLVGIHPEGTRNKTDDPYKLSRLTRGIGIVSLRCPDVPVLPIFVLGAGNNLLHEIKLNFTAPGDHPLDVVFGPPVDLSDLYDRADDAKACKEASRRCGEAIEALGRIQQELSEGDP